MKNWFPFTDYDFYAYLTSGGLALAVLDLLATGGQWLARENWTFVQIVLAVAAAYVTGQIAASFASLIVEHGIARWLLPSPVAVLLGAKRQGWFGKLVGRVVVGRYYAPLTEPVREKAWSVAATKLGLDRAALNDSEAVFQIAFSVARADADTRDRIDGFRNQYGFARNLALVSFVSAAAIALHEGANSAVQTLAAVLAIAAFVMLARFLKFYSAFAAEVLRALIR